MKLLKLLSAALIIATASSVFAWKKGDRILGQWPNGMWYPAKITGQTKNEFNVKFDDGGPAVLPASQVKKFNWKVGTKVQCVYKNRGIYYYGSIKKMTGESIHISYDDGDQEDTTISVCRSD
jgi:hypothetical protein